MNLQVKSERARSTVETPDSNEKLSQSPGLRDVITSNGLRPARGFAVLGVVVGMRDSGYSMGRGVKSRLGDQGVDQRLGIAWLSKLFLAVGSPPETCRNTGRCVK